MQRNLYYEVNNYDNDGGSSSDGSVDGDVRGKDVYDNGNCNGSEDSEGVVEKVLIIVIWTNSM